MKHLYAPWRGTYLTRDNPFAEGKNTEKICVFCAAAKGDRDQEYFVIAHTEYHCVLLNIHPYNPGHILIAPRRHTAEMHDLTQDEQRDLTTLLAHGSRILRQQLPCDGLNIGINSGGIAAGGSIPDHLHVHLLPRWLGDTNFLPTLADTKQLSADLKQVYERLYTLWHAGSS